MNGSRSIRFGRAFGIQLAFDYSWLFIVLLMTWSLASGFRRVHADWSPWLALVTALCGTLLFFGSVLLHELAHSLVARRFGVPVAGITLFLFGGVSNIERDPPNARAELVTAVVGPLTSIAIGVIVLLLGTAFLPTAPGALDEPVAVLARLGPVETLLLWLGPINLIVGVFNLVPAFPLDGGRILRAAIWAATHDLRTATRWAAALGQAFGWAFVALGVAMMFGASVPMLGRGVVGGMWAAFVGWFLSSAAAQTWRRQILHDLMEGVSVAHVMRAPFVMISPETDVATVVDRYLANAEERAFPVGDGDRFLGMVGIGDVRKAPRDEWPTTPVARVMTPAGRFPETPPDAELIVAFDRMVRVGAAELPVVDRGRLTGLLLRRDILRWIELHGLEGSRHHYAH